MKKSLISSGGGLTSANGIVAKMSIGQPIIGIAGIDTLSARLGFWYIKGHPMEIALSSHVREQNESPELGQNYPNPLTSQTSFDRE